jgi:hypothetical protein
VAQIGGCDESGDATWRSETKPATLFDEMKRKSGYGALRREDTVRYDGRISGSATSGNERKVLRRNRW